jgi:hypothetical protein
MPLFQTKIVIPHVTAPGIGQPNEIREINGRRWYWMEPTEEQVGYWHVCPPYETSSDYSEEERAPAVLCICGETQFTISFGEYRCFAHCACGRFFQICSG